MTDEMLIAQAQWLPQYADAIPAASQRLAAAAANGTRVKTIQTAGAARVPTKTIEEMARAKDQARANAQAADKGMMTQDTDLLSRDAKNSKPKEIVSTRQSG
jgi:alpha-galactosidase